MTQDEVIIAMAREAGFDPDYFDNIECSCDECNFLKEPLERFAALVAAHEREKQAEQEPVAWANQLSLKEFEPRDENIHHRLAAVADRAIDGFLTPLYAAPVRTKDLTDDEIQNTILKFAETVSDKEVFGSYRAVIAADREKNK